VLLQGAHAVSTFWHVFVGFVSIASIGAILWLLLANTRGTPGQSTDHVWDGDLRELNNPLPRWWFVMFILTIVFGIGYLQLYPGLGNFEGSLNWSQDQQLKERLAAVQQQRNASFNAFADRSVDALAVDPAALAVGKKVFTANCAGCHGQDASGAIGFPSLRDADWLYGGEAEAIIASVANGRQGQMPAFGAAMDGAAIALLAETVQHWNDPAADAARRAQGLKLFGEACAACHGAAASGNTQIGAPNLVDPIWLYGATSDQIQATIRKGNMPAHRTLLASEEIRLVAAYVLSLGSER
jgi:cytochrome c oxidase cbb3-type subunit 3